LAVLGFKLRASCLIASTLSLKPHSQSPESITVIYKKLWLKSGEAYALKIYFSLVLVAHMCNPSYSGGRDHEDQDWKPARANSSETLPQKKPITKKGLVEWLKV
jgi:hypothetical protein